MTMSVLSDPPENSMDSTESFDPRRKLIVNYIPDRLTWYEFRQIFSEIGSLEHINFKMNKYNNDQHAGYGFVTYANAEHAKLAIEKLDKLPLFGKTLKVSYWRDPAKEIRGTNLYVKNIPTEWDTENLENYFSQWGVIISCRVVRNKTTGSSLRYGFVRFDTRQEALEAVEQSKSSKSSIQVEFAADPCDATYEAWAAAYEAAVSSRGYPQIFYSPSLY